MFLHCLGISPCGASSFCSDAKGTKKSPGDVAFGKDLRLRPRSFMSHIPPDPCFTGGARGVRRQLRPARKPQEWCAKIITAVLLNELDRLLLQDAMRLSGAAYTVGGGRRAGPLFVCRGRCLIGPRAAPCGRPYGKTHLFRGPPPGGIPQRGPGGPLLVVSRSGDFKGERADSPYQGEMSSSARQRG